MGLARSGEQCSIDAGVHDCLGGQQSAASQLGSTHAERRVETESGAIVPGHLLWRGGDERPRNSETRANSHAIRDSLVGETVPYYVRLSLHNRNWRLVGPRAWKHLPLLQPGKLLGCIAISVVNMLWTGHGVLRSWQPGPRFTAVLVLTYVVVTAAEYVWLLLTMQQPVDLGFREKTPVQAAPELDPLVEQLSELPRAELKEETLQLAAEMRTFEAGSDGAYVSTLLMPRTLEGMSEEEVDKALDRESTELIQRHLVTWRVYRERFYRPARAFRDELRKRLGIRNPRREPQIPALDQAALTGAKPITEAADHLADLANRLR